MMTTDTYSHHSEHEGPTPAGGVRSVIYYLDDAGKPSDPAVATRVEITEYDAQFKVIRRTYAASQKILAHTKGD
jgi:hypothetical protein